jgi:hypothetical protein
MAGPLAYDNHIITITVTITPVARVDQASAGIATVQRADREPVTDVYLRRAEEERGHVPNTKGDVYLFLVSVQSSGRVRVARESTT